MVDASLLAFREISVLSKEINFINEFGRSSSKLSKASATIGFLNSLPRYIVESALIVGTLLLGAYTFSSQDVSSATGILAVFMTGSLRIMASMIPLQNSIGAIRELGAKSEPFYDLVERFANKTELIDSENEKLNGSLTPLTVEFNEVSFRYKPESDLVLNRINFNIDPGSMVAIIGPSGSGKSTVADLIAGLIEPINGKVCIGDQAAKKFPFEGIGYVPQRPGIFNGTILQNITLNFEENEFDNAQLQFALEEASLKELINNLPDGLSTNLGSQSDQLSGGQLQRIGLARALYSKPRLLLLDEATSALDPETEFVISNSIEKLRKDCTVIVIAHRMATIQKADKILVIDEGKLVAEGKFSELAQTNELLSRYIELSEISLD
jgi:ATP-binding cassette subfamily C protein